MRNNIENVLSEKVSEFNAKINDDPNFAKMIEGKDRTITICVSDGKNYASKLESLKLDDFTATENSDTDLAGSSIGSVNGFNSIPAGVIDCGIATNCESGFSTTGLTLDR